MEERKKIEIPDGVAPAVKEIITSIIDEINAGGLQVDTSGSDESTYGHAMRALAHSAFGVGDNPMYSSEDQLRLLKERAQYYVDKFGPKIIEKMSPRMVEALGIKE